MTKFRSATLKNINAVANIIINETVRMAENGQLRLADPTKHDVKREVAHALKFFPQTTNIRKTLKQKKFLVGLIARRLEANRDFMFNVYKIMTAK